MQRWIAIILLFLIAPAALAACGPTAAPTPTAAPAPTVDPFFAAQGAGEPRGAGYWLLWNSCAPDNRAETARANGGREAGWILMDDLLADPGILLGERPVLSCEEGVHWLRGASEEDDPAAALAGQLLAAQLNLAAGAEHCPAVDEAVQAAQLLLIDGDLGGDEMSAEESSGAAESGAASSSEESALEREGEIAAFLIEQLSLYNAGALCR